MEQVISFVIVLFLLAVLGGINIMRRSLKYIFPILGFTILLLFVFLPFNKMTHWFYFNMESYTMGLMNIIRCCIYFLIGVSLALIAGGNNGGFRVKKLSLGVGMVGFIYIIGVLAALFLPFNVQSMDFLDLIFPDVEAMPAFDYSLLPCQIFCITTGFLLIHGIYGNKNE